MAIGVGSWRSVAAALLLTAGWGCDGAESSSTAPLLVLAASDLLYALPEIVSDYEAKTGRSVRVTFGSTGNLTAQIEQGAPADVFLSANEGFVDRLESRGQVAPASRRAYAVGRLAVVWSHRSPPIDHFQAVGSQRVEVLAIPNPEHAPYGQAAREALVAAGIWRVVERRLVLGENVSHTLQFVETGNADVGIVALSVVMGAGRSEYLLVPADLHQPVRQMGVVLRASRLTRAAQEFLDYVTVGPGQSVLQRSGFEAVTQ